MDLFWEKSEWELGDRHLQKMRQMPFRRKFPFIPEEDGLYVIRGPRQIGKSSWLKMILSHHVRSDKKCFYLSCEEIDDYKSLIELLRSLRGYDLILLDEISFVPEWARAVKHAVDSGYTKILVVTGSHAYDLKQGIDRMPGRFDGGGEFQLLPMNFDEFCIARRDAGWTSETLLDEIRAYFRVGGFPVAVAEGGRDATGIASAMQTYWQWLVGDVIRLGKNEEYLTELMIQLVLTVQTPVSFNTLAKKTSIGSHNTVRDYISLLESCFALRTLHAIDIDSGAYRTRKDRKFYFTDPLLYWLALDLSGMTPPDRVESAVAEMVANEHLARRFKRFGYHSNARGEVDFVLPTKWAVEVKWSPIAFDLSKTYLQLSVPEKVIWTHGNFLSEWPQNT